MKRTAGYLIVCIFASCMSSCLTLKQKITVGGTPGTEIYRPNKTKKLGVIGPDGKTEIKVSRNGYNPFLLSYNPATGRYYPFGLDYRYRSVASDMMGFTLLAIPTIGMIATDLGYSSEQFNYGYRYLKNQSISPYPDAAYANSGERREVKSGDETKILLSATSSSNSTSKLLRRDYGKQLQGTYDGNGKLSQGNNTIETYNHMKVQMTRVDRNTVAVEILMDGNEAIFAPCNYTIKSQGVDSFALSSENDDSAEIKIKGDEMTYNNPNVNIDGEIYKLQISATISK